MQIIMEPNLSRLTSLCLGGTALAEIRLENPADFEVWQPVAEKTGGTAKILGGGSNLLIADTRPGEYLPWVILRPMYGNSAPPKISAEDGATATIKAGSGTPLPTLLSWCAKQGLSGLEGLAGIPGNLGGAIAMNAGAYGDNTGPLLQKITVFTPGRGLHQRLQGEWEYAYRNFKLLPTEDFFILAEAELNLTKSTSEKVQATILANLHSKKASQPLNLHTAGSVFKNPEQDLAWRLLDQAGLRGARVGGIFFTEKHANFMANDKTGTFAQAMELLQMAEEAVQRQSGIKLETEIKVWSCQL